MHKLRALTFDNLSYTDSKEYLQFVSMGGLRKLLHNTLKLDKNSVSAKQKQNARNPIESQSSFTI